VACTRSKVTFQDAPWSNEAAAHLAKIHKDAGFVADWRQGVLAGRLSLWAVLVDGERRGSLVWEVETAGDQTKSLVVLGMFSEAVAGVDAITPTVAVFEGLARLTGARSIKFWTQRPGLQRLTEKAGFEAWAVMEKVL